MPMGSPLGLPLCGEARLSDDQGVDLYPYSPIRMKLREVTKKSAIRHDEKPWQSIFVMKTESVRMSVSQQTEA